MKFARPSLSLTFPRWLVNLDHYPILAVSLLSVLIYIRGLNIQFIAEDFLFLRQFNSTFVVAWNTMLESSRLWPVGVVYRFLMYQLSGTNPAGYHLASYVIHAINVILVYVLVNHLSKNKNLSIGTALIFAVYPRHHQPILWMAGNLVPFSSVFFLTCLIAFERFLSSSKISWFIWSVVSLVLAVLSLEGTVILFPLLICMELFFFKIIKLRSLNRYLSSLSFSPIIKYIPLLLVFVLYFALTFSGPRSFKLSGGQLDNMDQLNAAGISGGDTYRLSFGINTIKEVAVYITYAVYPHIPLRSLDPNPPTIIFAGITLLLLILVLYKGTTLVRFAGIWLLLSILPYAFFATYGNADRYFYLSSIGFGIIVSWLVFTIANWLRSRLHSLSSAVPITVFSIYLIASFIVAQQRIHEWKVAGEMAEDILQQAVLVLPNPEPGSTIVYLGLPKGYGQATVFLSAFVTAVEMRYGQGVEEVTFFQSHDEEAIEYLKNTSPKGQSLENFYVLLYEDNLLTDKSALVSDLNSINPYSFSQW
jgi:hypothetical protein